MRSSRLAAVAALSTLTFASAPAARAADPVAWDSNSGFCSGTYYGSASSHTQQVARPAGVARVTTGGGPSSEVYWDTFSAVSVGSSASADLTCYPDPISWQASFYDTPSTPTTFAGQFTDSVLPVKIPRAGQYVADITVDQGAIEFGNTALASSGPVDLGTLRPGTRSFSLSQLEGPKTRWTARISALPVVLSAVKTDATYARSGDIVKLAYTVSGDTRVSAVVTDAGGTPVRSLATGLDAPMGERSLTWDARGTGGVALGDGAYALTVTSTDDQGVVSSGTAQITVDNVAPDATLTSPAQIKPAQSVVVTVTDAASGIDQVRDISDPTGAPDPDPYGYYSDPPPPGPVAFSVEPPYGGWKLGRHVLRIYALDKAGNSAYKDLAFTASANAGVSKNATSGGGAKWASCGSIRARHVFKLRTSRGPSCATAKRVARRAGGRRTARILGYICSRTSSTYTCRRSARTIRWNRKP